MTTFSENTYYFSLDSENMSRSGCEEGSSSELERISSEFTDGYGLYCQKNYMSQSYSEYEQGVGHWMNIHYPEASDVRYEYNDVQYNKSDKNIKCTKYVFETPYTILAIQIEHEEYDTTTLYICTSVQERSLPEPARHSDDHEGEIFSEYAKLEKNNLVKYLNKLKENIVLMNKEENDEYYEELRMERAIEYARDREQHCHW